MVAFWDSITKAATKTTSKAVQHAKNIADVAKLNAQIDADQKNIQTWQLQLGRLYATIHREDPEYRFSEIVKAIAEAEERVQQLQRQIQEIKGIKLCESVAQSCLRAQRFAALAVRQHPSLRRNLRLSPSRKRRRSFVPVAVRN